MLRGKSIFFQQNPNVKYLECHFGTNPKVRIYPSSAGDALNIYFNEKDKREEVAITEEFRCISDKDGSILAGSNHFDEMIKYLWFDAEKMTIEIHYTKEIEKTLKYTKAGLLFLVKKS